MKEKLWKINNACMAVSFVSLFTGNVYYSMVDGNSVYDENKGSLAKYLVSNSIYFAGGSAVKSAVLTTVYPLVWFDIFYSYHNNKFYKKHLILDYAHSREFIKYCNKK
jgi:hypothetical protein